MVKYIILKKLRNYIINKTNFKFSNNTDTVVLLELINLLGIREALKTSTRNVFNWSLG